MTTKEERYRGSVFYLGTFDTKINNVGISNVRISSVGINSAGINNIGFIFIKCLVHCFPPHLVFELKLYKNLHSNYMLELLCKWVKVNNCRTIFFYDLLTS